MREAKAMGCSVPSENMWEITAPTPYAEASAARVMGKAGS